MYIKKLKPAIITEFKSIIDQKHIDPQEEAQEHMIPVPQRMEVFVTFHEV